MNINLEDILILNMLTVDDEPLNLILEEALITDDNITYIKSPFNGNIVTKNDILKSLKKLLNENLIVLLDSKGIPLIYEVDELDKILCSNTEWEYWFRINEKGKTILNDNYSKFMID